MSGWSLECTGCGRCCNSAPQLSLPELFHHQDRFIGCLGLRKVPTASGSEKASEVSHLFHPLRANEALLLTTHAYDDGIDGRCAALGDSGACDIHTDRKPAICEAVPLEPLIANAHQSRVLESRAREAAFFGANCITRGGRGLPLLQDGTPTAAARAALERRRADLALEKRFYGNVVFRKLPAELFSGTRVPTRGLLTLSIVPALAVLGGASPRCRRRCTEYLMRQRALLGIVLARLPSAAERTRRQLEAFSRSALACLELLERQTQAPGPAMPDAEVAMLEAWLGIRG